MALFKIFKGNATGKITDPNNPEYILPTAATDGYAYYDTSTRKFYINADYNNNGTITRLPINAYHADGADAATLAQAAIYETTGEEGASVNSIRSYYAHNLFRSGDSILLRNGLGIDIGDNIDISDKLNKNFIVKFYDRIYDSDYIEGESSRYLANFNLQDFRNATLQNFGDCELQALIIDIDNRYVYTNYYMLTVIFYAVHVFYSIDVAMEGLNLNSINGVNYRYFAFADTGGNTIPDNNIFRGLIFVPSEETIENYLLLELENYITQESLEEYLSNYPTWDDLDTTIGDYLPLSGGTMTGNLILNANPSSNMQAANKQYVDNSINSLDVSNISGFGTGKTLKTLTETDGKIAATFQDIAITKSLITDFPGYWANIVTTTTATYNKEPEFKTMKLGNGTSATGTKSVLLVYDATLEALNFVFI